MGYGKYGGVPAGFWILGGTQGREKQSFKSVFFSQVECESRAVGFCGVDALTIQQGPAWKGGGDCPGSGFWVPGFVRTGYPPAVRACHSIFPLYIMNPSSP